MKTFLLASWLLGWMALRGPATAAAAPDRAGDWASPRSIDEYAAAPAPLLPFPREAVWQGDTWSPPSSPAITGLPALTNAQHLLTEWLRSAGLTPALTKGEAGDFVLRLDPAAPPQPEGYRLEVTSTGVVVTGRDPAGAFYAVQTLRQLALLKEGRMALALCVIRDWPAFGLRGFMHDTGRNFQEVASLKAQIDRLAAYKLNTFHWHLTDNPAWRPQSRIFPQLNDPAKRQDGRDPGQSYSFEEIRDLVRYAAARHVRIIPELDMPGHSAYFEPAFGFPMGSAQGVAVLEKLIDEFPFYGLKVHPRSTAAAIATLGREGRPLLEFAAAHDLPILVHAAFPKSPDPLSRVGPLFDLARAHPRLRFCAAHFGGFNRKVLEEADLLDNVWIDAAALVIGCECVRRKLRIYDCGATRIPADYDDPPSVFAAIAHRHPDTFMWGSDNPFHTWVSESRLSNGRVVKCRLWSTLEQEVALLRDVKGALRRKVAAENALRFLEG